MQIRMRGASWRALLTTLLVLGPAPGCERAEQPKADRAQLAVDARELTARSRAAALRGVGYLLRRGPEMPADWRSSIFERIYRIAPTDALARRAGAEARTALGGPPRPLPADFTSERLLEHRRLERVAKEVARRRQIGADWQEPARALQALVDAHETEIWEGVAINHQFVTLHLLAEAGVETRRSSEDVAEELRLIWTTRDQDELLVDPAFMYAITHVFYVGSGYFRHFMDPAAHPVEVEIMERGLERYAQGLPESSHFVDISAEILAARRLLRLDETEASLAVTRLLLELQNEDGSWLEPGGFKDLHATASAVHAFLEYPPEFRRFDYAAGTPGADQPVVSP